MYKERPINLDLTKFKFPPMAIVSIFHRITGVLIFLFLPLMLYLLDHSLSSQQHFVETHLLFSNWCMKTLIWIMFACVLFHFVAGIRHLLMDLGFGESLYVGHLTAYGVFIIAVVLIILAGVWLW